MEGEKWESAALQGIFLTLNALNLKEGDFNWYSLFAIVFILVLYTLQFVNRRFFIFFPVNRGRMVVDTSGFKDTRILRVLTIIYIALSLVGLALPHGKFSMVYASLGTLLIITPAYIWARFFHQQNRIAIAEYVRTQGQQAKVEVQCRCGCRFEAFGEILSPDSALVEVNCPNCGQPIRIDNFPINIGQ